MNIAEEGQSEAVDFLNMGIGDLRTGIFNIADVSIMVGLFIMLFLAFKQDTRKKKGPSSEESATQI